MNFKNAYQSPVVVTIGAEQVSIPRFTRGQWIKWAAEIDAQRAQQALSGVTDPEKRFQLLSFYTIPPTDFDDMRRQLFSLAGAERVVRECLLRVPGWDVVKSTAFIEANDPRDIVRLAVELSSVVELKAGAVQQAQPAAVDPLLGNVGLGSNSGSGDGPLPPT